jgi:streptogramin lyase
MKTKLAVSVLTVSVILVLPGLAILGPAASAASLPRTLIWEGILPEDEDSELRQPVALAAGPNNELAVADVHQSRVLFFTDTGVEWVSSGVVELPAAPLSLAHDGDRYLLSLRQAPWLVALEGDRHQMRNMPLPQDTVPGSVAALPDGGFLIHDLAQGRVLQLSPGGTVSARATVGAGAGVLAATAGGGFYALFPVAGEVRRYDAEGGEIDRWRVPGAGPVPAWPAGMVIEPSGSVILSDRHGNRLIRLNSGGRPEGIGSRRGWRPGLLLFPSDLARLADGRLAVADQGNGRVQFFRSAAGDAGS